MESTFSVAGQVSEDLEDDEIVSERGVSGRQLGGSRSSTSLAGRLRNWSRSQQTVVHEAEALEGEDADDVISSTLVEGRERTNRQQASPTRIVDEQERSSRTSEITRPSGKSQSSKPVSKVSNRVPLKPARTEVKAQSGGNRARVEEGKKGKVTTMKSSGRTNARSKSKRKAS